MKYMAISLLLLATALTAQEPDEPFSSTTFSGLKLRNVGPALQSGRIADIAVHPDDNNCWYVAVGSGGVWKTVNGGTTWTPVFDKESSYSIGCVTIDPSNPSTVWVGTGENVGGRHVGYGDGIYRSTDGGQSWEHMGLKESQHISRIIVHPSNPEVVFVAAQGPLWSQGGERGLYKSADGGRSWRKVLGGNEWTGVTDVVMDPEDPDWLYAATWQRHRNVASYIGGGPGSGIHRSTDGGENWEKMTSGIPGSNLGKIGLAISPFDRDVVYAAIELDRRKGGLFMSADRGVTWSKQSDAVSGATGPHYYQELYASPHHEGTLYLVDNNMQISDDHGKSFRLMNEEEKHGDNHAISFRRDDPDYLLVGTDGGLYESFDLAKTWRYVTNLPVTQFYKVAVDDAEPFYFIFGGTQDNGSQGGPSRTDNRAGIRNADWINILGADGHQAATEPGNPGIVYAETQQGGLHRIDRITGEQVYIQPQAGRGEPHERFNWDTPILVSPHNPARIYTASYRVWKSENRGDSWEAISGDLTRNQERMALPIMGRIQSWDNPWDIYAMSTYNTITSLAESPLQEGLIYAGTDDGIIQVTEDGGASWRKLEVGSIKGIPATGFVNDIRADLFDARTVYAVLDNHKYGDLQPYVIKSTDRGRSWTSMRGDLPDRTLVWRLVQDHVNKELIFAATEFGIYFTIDGGTRWTKLEGGVPTISFRDITIQRRENDLVAASFGRGFFILDDIAPLRAATPELLEQEAALFPVKDPWHYVPRQTVHSQGSSDFRAENPPFGAVFTYYLKEEVKSKREIRKNSEKNRDKQQADNPFPGWDALEKERTEDAPYLLFTVKDRDGTIVNQVKAPAKKGIHRVNWDLRHASQRVTTSSGVSGFRGASGGFMATPGSYSVTMYAVQDGQVKQLGEKQSFEARPLYEGVLEASTAAEIDRFRVELEALQREYGKVSSSLKKAEEKVKAMKQACLKLDRDTPELLARVHDAEAEVLKLDLLLNGNQSKQEVGEKEVPSPGTRMMVASRGLSTTYGPTDMHEENLKLAMEDLAPVKEGVEQLTGHLLPELEKALVAAGGPWITD